MLKDRQQTYQIQAAAHAAIRIEMLAVATT
jgi:hypothetical protein